MSRKVCLFATVALVFGATTAAAAGINLGWNDCPGGASYTLAQTFACDTNVGTHTIVGSFVAPAGLLAVTGHYAVIDFQTGGPSLSDWWRLRPGNPVGCRASSLGADFDFTGGPFTCIDYWRGGAIGGTSMDAPNSNRGRIKVQAALPAGDLRIGPISEGLEVYAFKVIIDNDRTVGPEACAGCADEVCLVLQNILITQVPGVAPNITLQTPATAHHVIWQGWSTTDPVQQCPAVTPVRNRTWGAIKAIYR